MTCPIENVEQNCFKNQDSTEILSPLSLSWNKGVALVSKSKKFLLQMSLFQYKTKKNKYIIPCSIFSITHSVFIFKYSYSIDCIFKYISQNRVLNYRAPMKQSPTQLQHNQWINNISKIQSTVNQLNFFGVKLIFKQTDILHGYLIDWILVWQNDVSVNLHWKQF